MKMTGPLIPINPTGSFIVLLSSHHIRELYIPLVEKWEKWISIDMLLHGFQ
jgi:hypothetical protein